MDKDKYKDKIFLEEYYKKQHLKTKKAKPTKYKDKPTVSHKSKTPIEQLTEFKVKY